MKNSECKKKYLFRKHGKISTITILICLEIYNVRGYFKNKEGIESVEGENYYIHINV